ncbi:MAG: DEAD/DEAH box helicase [Deltaproteobacteria bacterium]|nr:DEAD/DEAH box helicase [Deltaproteobacteria bacterium]
MGIAFESMNLRAELVAACRKQGFREATPIQALVIPAVMRGKDVVVEAKTGSGKTLAYGLPLLHAIPSQTRFPETLVIVPTRELAHQIQTALTRSAGKLERRVVPLTGGGGMDRQQAWLQEGATIVVGTMGRIEELLARKLLRLDHVRTLVLDEVDELLKGGFSGNLAALVAQLRSERQTLLFSATVPNDVEQLARKFMRQPERLRLTTARELPAELSHYVLRTNVRSRVADLGKFLRAERPYQVLLFCGTRHESEEVQDALVELGLQAEFLHGELSATKRRQLIEHFRGGDLPILVASDLAARGLDLPGVDLVVNYSLPDGAAPYLHRAGRTGRAGKPGQVVTLLIEQQQKLFEKLRQTLTFQAVEVHDGRVVRHALKSREERDLEYRQLPRYSPESPQGQEEPQRASSFPGKGRSIGERRSAPSAGPQRHEPQKRRERQGRERSGGKGRRGGTGSGERGRGGRKPRR